jgi:short-subunit dehydrogenase
MTNKIAVVTGASRGIGYETALQLAQRGYHVVALARTIGGLEELDDAIQKNGGSATLAPIDLTETAKLQALGPNLITRFPHVDLVVGAAGYLSKLTAVAQGPAELFTKSIALNATANLTLIQTVHPLLKKAPAGKAVFLTGSTDLAGKPFWGFYAASKAALNALVACYAAENPELDISTFTPQPTQTRLHEEAFPGAEARFTPEESARQLMQFIFSDREKAA